MTNPAASSKAIQSVPHGGNSPSYETLPEGKIWLNERGVWEKNDAYDSVTQQILQILRASDYSAADDGDDPESDPTGKGAVEKFLETHPGHIDAHLACLELNAATPSIYQANHFDWINENKLMDALTQCVPPTWNQPLKLDQLSDDESSKFLLVSRALCASFFYRSPLYPKHHALIKRHEQLDPNDLTRLCSAKLTSLLEQGKSHDAKALIANIKTSAFEAHMFELLISLCELAHSKSEVIPERIYFLAAHTFLHAYVFDSPGSNKLRAEYTLANKAAQLASLRTRLSKMVRNFYQVSSKLFYSDATANALAEHTRHLSDDQLSQPLPDSEMEALAHKVATSMMHPPSKTPGQAAQWPTKLHHNSEDLRVELDKPIEVCDGFFGKHEIGYLNCVRIALEAEMLEWGGCLTDDYFEIILFGSQLEYDLLRHLVPLDIEYFWDEEDKLDIVKTAARVLLVLSPYTSPTGANGPECYFHRPVNCLKKAVELIDKSGHTMAEIFERLRTSQTFSQVHAQVDLALTNKPGADLDSVMKPILDKRLPLILAEIDSSIDWDQEDEDY